ncbi:MAG: hypothetical protein OEV28_12015, partial [Nitrospirota bacterium]|nr:hypothetical protein [Nitrospirota bacterium]
MAYDFKTIVVPLITLGVATALLFTVRGLLFRFLHKWSETTHNKLDDIIIAGIKTPSIFWIVAVG